MSIYENAADYCCRCSKFAPGCMKNPCSSRKQLDNILKEFSQNRWHDISPETGDPADLPEKESKDIEVCYRDNDGSLVFKVVDYTCVCSGGKEPIYSFFDNWDSDTLTPEDPFYDSFYCRCTKNIIRWRYSNF